jgi:hypothetical protein
LSLTIDWRSAFFHGSSIRVARLLAYCVLISSLAELYLAFLHAECAGMLQMVEAITGRVISSMVIVLAFKDPLRYLTLFMV